VALLVARLAGAAAAYARERVLRLDPRHSEVRFRLGATLHEVEGKARLAAGEIDFDDAPSGGSARGLVRVDARSAETGIARRDRVLHAEVLESERFRWIELVPERLEVGARDAAHADVTLHGRIRIHGGEHPVAIPARVEALGAAAPETAAVPLRVTARFVLPYVEWGMKDVSTFVLRVAPTVTVEVDARGELTAR
jgi:polyisoprenoid-binding protein YceI